VAAQLSLGFAAQICIRFWEILALAKTRADEQAPYGIRVNVVCPGFIVTDMSQGKLTPEMLEGVRAGIPLGRAGHPMKWRVAASSLLMSSHLK